MPEERVTQEQATDALRQLLADHEQSQGREESAPAPEPEPEPEPEAPEAEPAPEADPEPTTEEPQVEAAATTEPATDDVASLRKRLDEIEAIRKQDKESFENTLKAFGERSKQNEQILRNRFLQKSTLADRARSLLEKVRSSDGASEKEVDEVIQEIRSTMNPASQSYAPPPPQQSPLTEEHLITLNDFLNEKGMTTDAAEKFGQWLQGDARTQLTPQEQAVADQSLDGFLRIAHTKWSTAHTEETKKAKQAEAVAAVKTVQKIQRQAARAAGAVPRAPTKTSGSPSQTPAKLTKEDVSALLRQTVLDGDRF